MADIALDELFCETVVLDLRCRCEANQPISVDALKAALAENVKVIDSQLKLATVEYEKTQQTALVTGSGEQLLLLTSEAHHDVTGKPAPELETMRTIIEGGRRHGEILDRLADPGSRRQVRSSTRVMCALDVALPQPVQIRDFGCFVDHFATLAPEFKGHALEDVELPKIRFRAPAVLHSEPIGGDRTRIWSCGPSTSSPARLRTRDSPVCWGAVEATSHETDAPAHIFGYTIFQRFQRPRDTQLERSPPDSVSSKEQGLFRDAECPRPLDRDGPTKSFSLDFPAAVPGVEVFCSGTVPVDAAWNTGGSSNRET
ncbi:unnamed protein product, partial [Mesorhabditis spiculigera]